MNRLQNAQKQLAESLIALESAVERAQNSTTFSSAGKSADTSDAEGSNASPHQTPVIDMSRLSQDLTAIEADLETAMNMIANLMESSLSPSAEKDDPQNNTVK